ncbi:MAG: POTRA domain-containing protein [Chitinophagaceae bacterium]|nr:POTRA domain-containing protein [Chitinophagaceae bacterium]
MQCPGKYVMGFLLMLCPFCVLRSQIGGSGTGTGLEDSLLSRRPAPDSAQTNPTPASRPFIVRQILITGNNKTKENIILRELPFKEDDEFQLQELVARFEDARRLLMNTTLFHEAIVSLKRFEGYFVDISVEVKERWYLFPLPYFKPVDRNINQWLIEQKGQLSRVDYGLKVIYNNATGRNDKMNIWLVNGYTKRVSLGYDRLYFDRKMKWGMRIGINMGSNREVNYLTSEDKQLFFKDESQFVRSFMNFNTELTYRRAIKTRHRFGIAWNSERVLDTVARLNPNYLPDGKTRLRFVDLYYAMSYFDVDFIPYPLKGYHADIFLLKRGFNGAINLWEATGKVGGNWPIARKTWLGLRAAGTVKLPFNQPYLNRRLLGYGDFFMQGYEYFVIDGVAGGYLKGTITKQLLGFHIKVPPVKNLAIHPIPVKVYAKIYSNMGYVYNNDPRNSMFNNKMLYSGGVGIDIVTFYDFVMRFEWSFNQIGQNALYLHRKSYY